MARELLLEGTHEAIGQVANEWPLIARVTHQIVEIVDKDGTLMVGPEAIGYLHSQLLDMQSYDRF